MPSKRHVQRSTYWVSWLLDLSGRLGTSFVLVRFFAIGILATLFVNFHPAWSLGWMGLVLVVAAVWTWWVRPFSADQESRACQNEQRHLKAGAPNPPNTPAQAGWVDASYVWVIDTMFTTALLLSLVRSSYLALGMGVMTVSTTTLVFGAALLVALGMAALRWSLMRRQRANNHTLYKALQQLQQLQRARAAVPTPSPRSSAVHVNGVAWHVVAVNVLRGSLVLCAAMGTYIGLQSWLPYQTVLGPPHWMSLVAAGLVALLACALMAGRRRRWLLPFRAVLSTAVTMVTAYSLCETACVLLSQEPLSTLMQHQALSMGLVVVSFCMGVFYGWYDWYNALYGAEALQRYCRTWVIKQGPASETLSGLKPAPTQSSAFHPSSSHRAPTVVSLGRSAQGSSLVGGCDRGPSSGPEGAE